MKKQLRISSLLALLLLAVQSINALPTKYWIQFKDKLNSPFSISNPEAFLSDRAIDRRTKQNIEISEQDFPVNSNYLAQVAATGATILNPSKWLNGTTVSISDSNQLVLLQNLPFVNQTITLRRFAASLVNNVNEDKFDSQLTAFTSSFAPYSYGASLNQIDMLHGQFLHMAGFSGQGIRIAVMDVGFAAAEKMAAFDSLRTQQRIYATKDFVGGGTDVYRGGTHGTLVLSTMATNLPGKMVGTAPSAEYILLRTEDESSESLIEEYNWVSAAEYADSIGADILSTSLGYSTFDNGINSHVYEDMNGETAPISIGADIAFAKGMLVVNSAGNEGQKPWHYILAPSDAKNILSVGAVDSIEFIASFSSRGPTYDGRIKPEIVAKGSATTLVSPDGNIITGNGTSFSCPVISGMIACLWQSSPGSGNEQVREAVLKSASQYATPDNVKGYGVPDFAIAANLLRGAMDFDLSENRFFPLSQNPFSSNLLFNYFSAKEQKTGVYLYSALGKLVWKDFLFFDEQSFNVIQVPGSTLSSGIYFFILETDSGNYVSKLIKVN